MTRIITRLLVTLVLAASVVLGLRATGVFAHAEYERSTPAKDEVAATAPAQLDVYFTQEVFREAGANFVRVFNDAGTQVSDGDGVIDDSDRKHLTATLPPGLPNGRYIVRWQTLSDADGDDDEGAFCFYVVVPPTAEQAAECAAFDEAEPTPSETAAEASPTATTTPDDSEGSSNTGIIVGAIVAVAAVVVVIGGGALYLRQRQQG